MPWNVLVPGTLAGLSVHNVNAVIGAPPARFYMTGDGHRLPPFEWATRPAVRLHFLQAIADGTLCLHVEQHQEDVSEHSIPAIFVPVWNARKVYGWELSMFRDLLPVMTLIMDILQDLPNPSLSDVVRLDREMVRMDALAWRVGNPGWITAAVAQSFAYRTYWNSVLRLNPPPAARVVGTENAYMAFINTYNNNAMQLRTDANNFIAANIQRAIALHPGDTHLITLGDTHLTINPVQQYLQIGALPGYVDASQH